MAALNRRGTQVVSFFTTGKRAAQGFGLPAYVTGYIQRYGQAKIAALQVVNARALELAPSLIKQAYTIPASELTDRVKIASTPDTFRLFASTFRFPLSLFNGHWDGRSSPGATAEIVRGQTKTYQHAFIAPGRYRGRTIGLMYVRKDGQKVRMQHGNYVGQLRAPIVNLRGPSTYQMITGMDNGGTKWVRLADQLGNSLRDLFFSETQKAFEASNGG